MRKCEGVEPRNKSVTPDQSLHLLEVSTCISEMRKCFSSFSTTKTKRLAYTEVSGSKSIAGRRIDLFGTWENLSISECYS